LGQKQTMIGTRADQDWDGSRQRLGVGQPKIRKGVDKDWNRNGPRLGLEQSKIVKGVNQIGTGEAQDWEKCGVKIGNRAAQDGTGTQTPRLGQEQPKTRTEAAEDWNST
jgi:hypothetical protein